MFIVFCGIILRYNRTFGCYGGVRSREVRSCIGDNMLFLPCWNLFCRIGIELHKLPRRNLPGLHWFKLLHSL